MNAYIVDTDKRIEPFGDQSRDCLIANRRLGDLQHDVLRRLDMQVKRVPDAEQIEDHDEHIVLKDSLYFTEALVKRFVVESQRLERPTVCALGQGLVTRHTMVQTQDVNIHADRVEYGLWYVAGRDQRGPTAPLVIAPDQFSQVVPLPEHMHGGTEFRIPVSDLLLVQVDHWANLWSANIGALLAEAASLMKAPRRKLALLALKARSINKWKILQQANSIGKNCDIHPTAYIEGSSIGDHVTVGAGAVIRLSHIGDRTTIGSNATVECSVVGERCALDSMSGAFASVLYPGTASSAKLIYISVCGRDSFLADGVFLADFRFDRKNVTVMKDGVVIDTGNIALGVCLGHGVYLGAGCVVAPGRAIGNGLRILPEGTRVISQSDSDGSVPGHRTVIPDGQ
jgi:NDP-sugar pyrophosphorylase family protein